jgi:hypothetical protein
MQRITSNSPGSILTWASIAFSSIRPIPIKAPFSKDSLVMSYRTYVKKVGDTSQDKAPGTVSLELYPG